MKFAGSISRISSKIVSALSLHEFHRVFVSRSCLKRLPSWTNCANNPENPNNPNNPDNPDNPNNLDGYTDNPNNLNGYT